MHTDFADPQTFGWTFIRFTICCAHPGSRDPPWFAGEKSIYRGVAHASSRRSFALR